MGTEKNTLPPSVLIGGPPHAGKSVLFHALTRELHQRHVPHHAIRACPDGEGNWFQELVPDEAQVYRFKGEWTAAFTHGICDDLRHRHLPMLVDMGGLPKSEQVPIFRLCTHSLLLVRTDEPESAAAWDEMACSNGLIPLARLASEQEGESIITAFEPVITGTITGLERSQPVQGPVFFALVDHVSALFDDPSYEQANLSRAPAKQIVQVTSALRELAPGMHEWEPELLPALLSRVTPDKPLAVYGSGPHWLYAALLAHARTQEFSQFDPRLGWITPPTLHIGSTPSSEIEIRAPETASATLLQFKLLEKRLDIAALPLVAFPLVDRSKGLILSGAGPSWLTTALVRHYLRQGVAWIACFQPQIGAAVIVSSQVPEHRVGDRLLLPTT
jgi:CRISPR-associated protein Csx3